MMKTIHDLLKKTTMKTNNDTTSDNRHTNGGTNENTHTTTDERVDTVTEEKRKIYNLIILDESGSMGCIWDQTISGCNETLQTILAAQKEHDKEQEQYVSIYAFDDTNSRYLVKDTPIGRVREITKEDYHPCGCTPLYDAVGNTVSTLYGKIAHASKSIGMVTIITDGYENASKEFRLRDIQKLIGDLKKEGWVFTFIGANIEAAKVAESFNIESSYQFQQTDEGTQEMFRQERMSRRRFYGDTAAIDRGHRSERERRQDIGSLNEHYFDHPDDDKHKKEDKH
jgi:hypothetical protein